MRREAKVLRPGRGLHGFLLIQGLLMTLATGSRAEQVLVDVGASWKYWKGTVAPPAGWNTRGFNDSAPEWLAGPTGVGYGDNDDATVLDDMQMMAANAGYMAFFARHAFDLPSLAGISTLILQIDYDDGFVAYLNDAEVARRGLGVAGSPVLFNQAAASHEADAAGREFIQIPVAALKAGSNLLAIELHNTLITSSDASLIPRLIANGAAPPAKLTCLLVQGTVHLSWLPGAYDSVRVERDGAVLATLAVSETTYLDAAPSPLDNHYRVVGESGGTDLSSNVCTVACTQGVLTCALVLEGGVTKAHLTWSDVPDVTSVQIVREGEVRATLTAGETSFTDPNVEDEMPESDTDYTVTLTTSSGQTCTLTCAMSLCPTITGTVVGGQIVLTIGNNVKAWDHFEISRSGAIIDGAVPGSATTWTDPDAVLIIGSSYDYLLHPVAALGGELPAPGTVCDATFTLGYAPEVGSYNPPAGGWDYVIDFTGPGDRQYNAVAGVEGNLDGRWIRSIDRDLWNGKGPDDVPGPAPAGPAPGGVDIVSVPGLGSCGSDAKVLRILDPGDTSVGIGTAFPTPFVPPSNSRILLGLDLGVTDQNVLKSGITLTTRIRLSPNPPAYMNAQAASGDGEPIANGMGMVGVYYKDTGALPGEGTSAAASFSCQSGANSGDLQFSSGGQDVDAIGTLNFVTIWMTVAGGAQPDTYDAKIYLNGSVTLSTSEVGGVGLTLANGAADFGPSVVNYLAIGSNDTGNDAFFEVDFVGYKLGVHEPTANPCSGNPPSEPRNLAAVPGDGKVDLAWGAPSGGPPPVTYSVFRDGARIATVPATQRSYSDTGRSNGTRYCYRLRAVTGLLESADSNEACATPTGVGGTPLFRRGDADGNGQMQLTDAVRILNVLFLGTGQIPCSDSADADDNGQIQLTDAVRILNVLFLGTGEIPAPGAPPAACGADPTPNDSGTDLGCVQYNC